MGKILKFLAEVKAEFKNITWPKKDALIELTIVVISISIFVSLILGGFDYLFTKSFSFLGSITNSAPPVQTQPIDILPNQASTPASVSTPSVKPNK